MTDKATNPHLEHLLVGLQELLPELADLCAPHAAHHEGDVRRVVAHHVHLGLVRRKELLHRRNLARVDAGVKVAGEESLNLEM